MSFLTYAICVHKNATPKNWLMWAKGLRKLMTVHLGNFSIYLPTKLDSAPIFSYM